MQLLENCQEKCHVSKFQICEVTETKCGFYICLPLENCGEMCAAGVVLVSLQAVGTSATTVFQTMIKSQTKALARKNSVTAFVCVFHVTLYGDESGSVNESIILLVYCTSNSYNSFHDAGSANI